MYYPVIRVPTSSGRKWNQGSQQSQSGPVEIRWANEEGHWTVASTRSRLQKYKEKPGLFTPNMWSHLQNISRASDQKKVENQRDQVVKPTETQRN